MNFVGTYAGDLRSCQSGTEVRRVPKPFDAARYAKYFERPFINQSAGEFLFEKRRLDPRVVRWCRLTSWRDRQGIDWLQIPYYDMEGNLTGVQWRYLGSDKSQPRFRFPYGSQCGRFQNEPDNSNNQRTDMIQDFSVSNFYSIRNEQKLSFVPIPDDTQAEHYLCEVKPGVKLLKLGIIYGSNASGKSNVLMALGFFRDLMLQMPPDKMSEIEGYAPFLLDNTSRHGHCNMRLVFWQNQERYVHEVELDSSRIYHESLLVYSSQRPTVLYQRSYDAGTDRSRVVFGAKSGISKKSQMGIEGNTINNCTVMAAFGKSNVEASRLNMVYEFYVRGMADTLSPSQSLSGYVVKHLQDDRGGRLKPFLLNMLKASDFNIVDFDIREEEIPITPQMELAIKNAPFPVEDREEMLKRGTLRNEELAFLHTTSSGGRYELSEMMESRGTQRYMGMSTILFRLLQN